MVSGFQFPLHRDPRCNNSSFGYAGFTMLFQFPLHRDPRCNEGVKTVIKGAIKFQFPLHRDPRCNLFLVGCVGRSATFQFPLHRDPRCNTCCCWPRVWRRSIVSVPFTSGSSLQPEIPDNEAMRQGSFSSLYIGILAATRRRNHNQ